MHPTVRHVLVAEGVKLAVVLCDGGEKDDTHKAENVLSNELGPSGSEFNTHTLRRVEKGKGMGKRVEKG